MERRHVGSTHAPTNATLPRQLLEHHHHHAIHHHSIHHHALHPQKIKNPKVDLQPLNPPFFFGTVESLVYRSNICTSSSFEFLKHLNLNTILYLHSPEDHHDSRLSPALTEFITENDITCLHLGANVDPADARSSGSSTKHWKPISEDIVKEAIESMLDRSNHPILIMCKTGVHLTGTVIGCLRRLLNWSLTGIIDEYRNQAVFFKPRFENEQFIELFDTDLITLPTTTSSSSSTERTCLPEWFQRHLAYERQELEELAQARTQMEKHTIDGDQRQEYQKHVYATQGRLVSHKVVFSIKKSIIGDDDED